MIFQGGVFSPHGIQTLRNVLLLFISLKIADLPRLLLLPRPTIFGVLTTAVFGPYFPHSKDGLFLVYSFIKLCSQNLLVSFASLWLVPALPPYRRPGRMTFLYIPVFRSLNSNLQQSSSNRLQ